MANALGKRMLDRWKTGLCTFGQLQQALTAAWITQDEYNAAIEACPPVDPLDPNSLSVCGSQAQTAVATETPSEPTA